MALRIIEIVKFIQTQRRCKHLLSDVEKDKTTYSREKLEKLVNFTATRKLSKSFRNYIASVVKKLRNVYPFQPTDYSDAKSEFIKFVNEGGITSIKEVKDGDYVTCIRVGDKIPVKGKRYAQYFLNGRFGATIGDTIKVDAIYASSEAVGGHDGVNHIGLSIGQFRFATDDEINNISTQHTYKQIFHIEEQIKDIEQQIRIYKIDISKHREKIKSLLLTL